MKFTSKFLLLLSVAYLSFGSLTAQNQSAPACGVSDVADDPRADAAYKAFISRAQENQIRRLNSGTETQKTSENPTASKYIIPCIIHVMYQNPADSLLYDQIYSQFKEMYNDFRRVPGTRAYGGGVDTEIEFNLATKDDNGNPFDGIIYHKVDNKWVNFNQEEDVALKTQIAPSVNPRKYFNIWLTKTIKDDGPFGQLAGYAQFPDPGMWWGGRNERTDGVVCIGQNFGMKGSSSNYSSTMSHEIGHWLWLYHTFQGSCPTGGASCSSQGDRICDTPPVTTAQFKDPNSRINSCRETPLDRPDNPRNYMDYTSPDDATNVFTAGQRDVFHFALEEQAWPWRYNLWQQANLEATGTGKFSRPKADFYGEPTVSCVGNPIRFSDYSMGVPQTWEWEFPGGTPATSTAAQPIVTYATPGKYTVRLKIRNAAHGDSITKTDFITVFENKVPVTPTTEFLEEFSLPSRRDFPPAGWRVENPDEKGPSSETWTMTTAFNSYARRSDTPGSAVMPFYNYSHYNQYDGLVMPPLDLTQLNTPTLRFDYAYAPITYRKENPPPETGQFSGTQLTYALGLPYNDTIQVKTSTDCGKTWNVVWRKGGRELSTSRTTYRSDVNGSGGDFRNPSTAEWDSTGINLTDLKNESNVLVKFEGISGFGNFFYLDRVRMNNIPFVNSSPFLKPSEIGFDLFPNPTTESVAFRMKLGQPAEVSYELTDIHGRVLLRKNEGTVSEGVKTFEMNLSGQSAGVYFLKLISDGKYLAEKIIKQ